MKTRFLALIAVGICNLCARAEEKVFFSFDDESIPWLDNLKLNQIENGVLDANVESASGRICFIKLFNVGSVSGNFATVADTTGTGWSFNPATGIATVTALAPTVNLNPTNIVVSVSGNQLAMGWPADHIGWFLQSNSVSLANSEDWFNIPGSDVTNKVIIPIDSLQTNVFYRMKY